MNKLKLIGYAPAGDKKYSPEDTSPNMLSFTNSALVAAQWESIGLRVVPIYAGDPIEPENFVYKFRNLSCNCVDDDYLWCVKGVHKLDNEVNMVGVLEWCYSEADAKQTLSIMKQDKNFTGLRAEKWIK